MIHRSAILLSLFIIPISLFSQHKITGKVVNNNNTALEFAEISLLLPDSIVSKSRQSRESGDFSLEEKSGKYILQVKYLGRALYYKDLSVDADIDLGMIKIEPYKEMQGVTVASKKKLIERKIDRTIFNVEHSILSGGMDLTQVLKGTPMLTVSDFGVSIVGKSSVAVMIDDRMVHMSGSDLMNYLKSLRSDDIARIEIITAPPAKYDAQGNSGIINIVLKKDPKTGWSSSFSSAYTQTAYPGIANNGSLNYLSKKLHATLRLRQYNRSSAAVEKIDVVGVNSILSDDRRKDRDNGVGANVTINYKINKKSTIGFIYDAARQNSGMDITNTSIYKTNNFVDSILNTRSKHRSPAVTHILNTYFDHKLDSLGGKLSIGINYFSTEPETAVNFETTSNKTVITEKIKNESDIKYNIRSGQADLYLPLKRSVILEVGAKFTNFNNNSDVRYSVYNDQKFILDPAKSNLFDYEEGNYAGYVSVSKDFNKKWSSKAGLRYEYSAINGYSPTTGQRTKYNYGNLFPTFYLQHNIDKNNTITFNYSKRINRPGFRALNPFRWYSNPYTFYTGNPLLQPSFNHNAELTYLYKSSFSMSLYGQKMINGYSRIVSVQNGIKEVNYKNFLTRFDAGSNVNVYVYPEKWWELSSGIAAAYSVSGSSIAEVLPQEGFSFYYNVNNTFTISKAKQMYLFANFWHSLPARQSNVYSQQLSSLSTGLRFSLFDKKIRINTSVEDIYKGLVSKGKVYYTGFTQFYNNYYDTRRFTFSITYIFGNRNVSSNSKKVQFNEKNRAG